MSKDIYLNLGSGLDSDDGFVNVDITKYEGVDKVVDLSIYPWSWEDESISGIHAYHIIEHFADPANFISECHRILKKGGFLRIKVPHSSSAAGIGCLGHYRTYSYNTFKDYLSVDFYMFGKKKFDTVEQKLLWWYEGFDVYGKLPLIVKVVIKIFNPIFNFLARLSPEICENGWCYLCGGMKEVIWRGIKL